MKQLLFALCIVLTSVAGRAQTLRITNTTSCDVQFIARASDDAGGVSACNYAYWTGTISLPPGGVITLTAADLPMLPAGQVFHWSHVRFYDPYFPQCPSSVAGPCPGWTGSMNVGDPYCGLIPPNDCMNNAPCSPCAGGAVNAAWTWLTSQDADIQLTP